MGGPDRSRARKRARDQPGGLQARSKSPQAKTRVGPVCFLEQVLITRLPEQLAHNRLIREHAQNGDLPTFACNHFGKGKQPMLVVRGHRRRLCRQPPHYRHRRAGRRGIGLLLRRGSAHNDHVKAHQKPKAEACRLFSEACLLMASWRRP